MIRPLFCFLIALASLTLAAPGQNGYWQNTNRVPTVPQYEVYPAPPPALMHLIDGSAVAIYKAVQYADGFVVYGYPNQYGTPVLFSIKHDFMMHPVGRMSSPPPIVRPYFPDAMFPSFSAPHRGLNYSDSGISHSKEDDDRVQVGDSVAGSEEESVVNPSLPDQQQSEHDEIDIDSKTEDGNVDQTAKQEISPEMMMPKRPLSRKESRKQKKQHLPRAKSSDSVLFNDEDGSTVSFESAKLDRKKREKLIKEEKARAKQAELLQLAQERKLKREAQLQDALRRQQDTPSVFDEEPVLASDQLLETKDSLNIIKPNAPTPISDEISPAINEQIREEVSDTRDDIEQQDNSQQILNVNKLSSEPTETVLPVKNQEPIWIEEIKLLYDLYNVELPDSPIPIEDQRSMATAIDYALGDGKPDILSKLKPRQDPNKNIIRYGQVIIAAYNFKPAVDDVMEVVIGDQEILNTMISKIREKQPKILQEMASISTGKKSTRKQTNKKLGKDFIEIPQLDLWLDQRLIRDHVRVHVNNVMRNFEDFVLFADHYTEVAKCHDAMMLAFAKAPYGKDLADIFRRAIWVTKAIDNLTDVFNTFDIKEITGYQ